MKKFCVASFMLAAFFAQQAMAESFYLESIWRYETGLDNKYPGAGKFAGFNVSSDENKFNATPTIPYGGITSADDVTVEWFADIVNCSVDVNTFTYISSGKWDNGFSFNGNVTLKAKEIFLKTHWDNRGTYNPDNDDVRDIVTLNVYQTSVTFKGNMTNTSGATLNIGTNYTSGNQTATFDAYDANTAANYKFNEISFAYNRNDTAAAVSSNLIINSGATVDTNYVYLSSYPTGENRSTRIDLNGGTLNTGGLAYQMDGDNVTINHLAGTLGVTNSVSLSRGSHTGSFVYVLGENAIFNTNGYKISIDSTIDLRAADGVKAGFTVNGGGDFVLSANLDAITGDVHITDGVMASVTGWFSNANSVRIDAGSNVGLGIGANLELDANSDIIIGVADEFNFGSIGMGEDIHITSADGSYGALMFVLDAGAFRDADSITLSLSEVIGDSEFVNWDSFDISSNFDYELDAASGSITFAVPEPSAVAAVLGAFALALVAVRRRRG